MALRHPNAARRMALHEVRSEPVAGCADVPELRTAAARNDHRLSPGPAPMNDIPKPLLIALGGLALIVLAMWVVGVTLVLLLRH